LANVSRPDDEEERVIPHQPLCGDVERAEADSREQEKRQGAPQGMEIAARQVVSVSARS